ncbi:MAG: J domain-containing protein [Sphingomonas sp.]
MYGGADHYAVLGLHPSADDVVVHAAWKALLRKHHPDTNPDDSSGARAREINEAFSVLGKPDARARYDRQHILTPSIAPLWSPPPRYTGPRYRPPPPRRRFSTSRVFFMGLLSVAFVPVAITGLLAYPGTGPATHDALRSYSAGSPFAEDLVSWLDAAARVFTADAAPSAASIDSVTNDGDGEVAANN